MAKNKKNKSRQQLQVPTYTDQKLIWLKWKHSQLLFLEVIGLISAKLLRNKLALENITSQKILKRANLGK